MTPKPTSQLFKDAVAYRTDSQTEWEEGDEYHARIHPILERVGRLIEAAERANQEIHVQKAMWPAEVDTLADSLADLRAALGGGSE